MTTFHVQCPACQREIQVTRQMLGRQVGCPHCQAVMTVPATAPTPPSSGGDPIRLACPHCQGAFLAPANLAGRPSQCPHCRGTVLIPAAQGQSSGEAEDNSEPSPIRPHPQPVEIEDPLRIDLHGLTVRWKGRQRRVRRLSDEEKSRRQGIRNLMFAGMGVVILVLTVLLMTQLGSGH